jgi:hypothetical protein
MANHGTASGSYTLAATPVGKRTRRGTASAAFTWSASPVAHVPRHGNTGGIYSWELVRAVGDNGDYLPDDRFRVIVQETQGGAIVSRDLTVTNLVIQRALSAGCDIQFDVNPNEPSVQGIYFKPWEHYIHIEKTMQGKRKIWVSGIVQPSDIDEKTGILHLKAKGFAAYPKGIPWLEDLNWIANDAYEPVVEIWRHLQQDFPNGNLHVEVFPTTSGVEMLPGYSYDGSTMNLNFFATFVRAADKLDCGDYIDAMARDIPFDYAERSEWNHDRTDVVKKIELGYPRLGKIQPYLAFVLNENVLSAKPHTETQIDWISDVGVTGFFPGFQYCVTDDTETLTREGWRRYDEIDVGATALTLNNDTGLAEWEPVEAVNVFDGERWIYETEFRGHSSATTAEHRWPVQYGRTADRYHGRRWSTTATLKTHDRIDCAVPVVDLPSIPKYDDALVELMAWYWTEGTYTKPGGKITIAQWGAHMARIKAAATRLFGPELPDMRRKGGIWDGAVWKSNSANTVIRLGTAATDALLEHITDYRTKAVSYDFIANLTQAQLELFINCSVWADCDSDWNPANHATFGQKFECNIDMLQFACQLAGRKTTKRLYSMNDKPWYVLGIYAPHRTQIKAKSMLDNMTRRWHKGVVWCPTTPNRSWCARRNGTVYFTGNSFELANADPNRLRRYLDETAANLDSNERSKAWAHRLLARRQTPAYWETITIDMHHPNAPFGSFDVGDTITVSGAMPWIGEIAQDHKIIGISVDDTKNACQLTLKAEGEFNYDPIFYPDGSSNMITNHGFDYNLDGWTPSGAGWTHDASQGVTRLGSATITADGHDHDLMTQAYGLSHFQIFPLAVSVKCLGAVSSSDNGVQLIAQFYDDALNPVQAVKIANVSGLKGIVPWQTLKGNVLTPTVVGATKVALRLHVGAEMTAGQVWFDDAEVTL